MKLLVVTVSVRKGRVGTKITDWFVKEAKKDARFDVNVVDLKELNLSYEITEKLPAQIENSEYEDASDRAWAKAVNEADAVVFVSPEYNHGYSAALKNAVDHLYHEWRGKPAAFVNYGSAGAPYSYAAFGLVASWVGLDVIGARVAISEIWAAFDEDDNLVEATHYNHEAQTVLNGLAKKVEEKK